MSDTDLVAPPSPVPPGTWQPPWRWALRVAVVVPIVVAVVRALARGWFPIGDDALLTLRAADVFTRHHPLLGSWTSASLALGTDVNNPGPLYDDLLAPFMWAIGRPFGYAPAVAVGVGAINAAAAIGTLIVAARLGGWRAERWLLLLVAALTWSMGSELLFDIWQPHALLLPFVLLVVLTVGLASGDAALAPWWAGVLSLVVQTHIGYAYVGAALVALIVVAWTVRVRRGSEPEWRRSAALTGAVVAIAWAQPLWEQLFGEGQGNLSRLATSAGGGDLTIGAGNAVRLLGAVLVVPPWWTRFGFADAVLPAPLEQTPTGPVFAIPGLPGLAVSLLGVVGVVAVLAWLTWALRGLVRWAVGVALLLVLVGVATLAVQVVGVTGLGSHQVRWIFAMAAYVHVVLAWGVASVWAARRRRTRDPLPAGQAAAPGTRGDAVLVGVVAVLVVGNLGFQAHSLGPVGDRHAADTLRPVFADLTQFDPGGPVVYDVENFLVFEPYSSAVIMHLVELGVDVRLDHEGYLRQYGPSRRADGAEPVRVFQYEREDALLYAGPGCIVSRRSALSDDAAAEVDAVIDAAAADVATAPIDVAGMPADVAALAAAGDGFRIVARGLLPVLVDEARIARTPAIDAAVAADRAIVERVNTTLAIVAEPAGACDASAR